MTLYPVRKYGIFSEVDDDADAPGVEMLRLAAIQQWSVMINAEGYQPLPNEPTCELHTKPFPQYVDLDGEQIKLPDRAWRVSGRVINRAVPAAMLADIRFDHYEIQQDDTP